MSPHQAECKIAETLGGILSRSRCDLRLETAEISAKLGVPEKWLWRFESDDWAAIPDDAYSRIYFKSYCRYLGLDPRTMIGLYRQARQRAAAAAGGANRRLPSIASTVAPDRRHPTEAVTAWQMVTPSHLIRNGLLGLVGLGLIGYFWWAVTNIVTPPKIALISPVDGLVVEDRNVTVEGRTEGEVSLRINGQDVAPDSDGYFHDSLDLAEGLNTIKVVGAKKHSKETTVTRRIIVQPAERAAAILPSTTYGPPVP